MINTYLDVFLEPLCSPINIDVFRDPSTINVDSPRHPMGVNATVEGRAGNEGFGEVLNLLEIFFFDFFTLMTVVNVI